MNASPKSLAQLFLNRVAASGPRPAFRFLVGEKTWTTLSWSQAGDRVQALAAGFLDMGLKSQERVGILCSTRVEWILADLGVLCAGGATTTVYPSSTSAESAFILNDSTTRFVFAENGSQVEKLVAERSRLPRLERIIVIDGEGGHGGWVISLADLEKQGAAFLQKNPSAIQDRVASIKPDHLATLIYTSGTTGNPKGVELTHDCWLYEAESLAGIEVLSDKDLQYLWLPLSHSFGKVLEVAQLQIGFETAIDGNVSDIARFVGNLAVVRPTFMAAAPRIFEKVYNRALAKVESDGGLKLKIFNWSVGVGREVSARTQKGQGMGPILGIKYAIANKLVFSKMKERFGGRVRFFISGSAALSRELAEFFHAAGILILEGYGLTESSAGAFVNRPDNYRFGSVGLAFPGLEVKIAEADGEILIRGRNIMRGYHNLPEATAEALDGRWLRTGDIGELDRDGFLRITDRKKDLIKTSGGKYVAPQKLEGSLKAACPYLSQVLVHGNNRNFCSALVTLDPDGIVQWAKEKGLTGTAESLATAREVYELVESAVTSLNKSLASYETIKKFAILPRDWSVETGELTPSFKVKRKVIETNYRNILEGFYQGAIKKVG